MSQLRYLTKPGKLAASRERRRNWIAQQRTTGNYNTHGRVGEWTGCTPAKNLFLKLRRAGIERDAARVEALAKFAACVECDCGAKPFKP